MKLKIFLFSCCIILIFACEQETALDRYYDQPGNFSGSIYDALDSTGLHQNFVRGLDSAYYANTLRNTLVTVIAPSDNAFEAYFNKHGYDGLSSVPKRKLEDLIGHHIVIWPQSPSVFSEKPKLFKRQTSMAQDTVSKYDIISDSYITVVQEAKYLQFYCPAVLTFNEATADDYNILTGSEMSPTTGFNIYNVPVDSVVPYGNGWVYYVDQVVEPFQNLDDWLAGNPDYSMFNDMYNRFNIFTTDGYVYDGIPSNTLIKRSNLYKNERHYRIDMELCFETVGNEAGLGDRKIYPIAHSNYSIMVPENNALESFIDNTFTNYPGFKESLSAIDPTIMEDLHIKLIMRQIISPFMLIEQNVFPSHLYNGKTTGSDGTVFQYDPSNFLEYALCSNGFAYGLNTYLTPRTFKSILKPAVTTPDFKFMTAAVDFLEINNYLNDKDATYTLFLPTDEAFLKNNIHVLTHEDATTNWGLSADNRLGLNEYILYNADTTGGNEPEILAPIDLFDLIFNHLFVEDVTPSSQTQFLVNALAKYVGITQDSIWSGGNTTSRLGSRTVSPEILEDLSDLVDNGNVYVVDDIVIPPKYTFGELIAEDTTFSRFKELCEDAGLYADEGLQVFGEFPTAFIPTNAALLQYKSEGKLPSSESELQSFVKYFFVNRTVFTNETINETVETVSKDEQLSTEFEIVYLKAELSGTYDNLKIKGLGNTTFLDVTNTRNIICDDGIIHQINGVLY